MDALNWSSETVGDGDWFLATVGHFTPLSLLPTSSEGGAEGNYVVLDQEGAADSALFQSFTVPPDAPRVILSYDMFVNDWSDQTMFSLDQHARVDLLSADAPTFDTEQGVILNMYLGTDGGPLPNPFVHYEFDISPFVGNGGEFQLRFLATNMPNSLNVGVDNVSVQAIPEPSAKILVLVGLLLVGRVARKRRFGHVD